MVYYFKLYNSRMNCTMATSSIHEWCNGLTLHASNAACDSVHTLSRLEEPQQNCECLVVLVDRVLTLGQFG